MPPRGPRPPSVNYGLPKHKRLSNNNRDSAFSFAESEVTIRGDSSPTKEKGIDTREDVTYTPHEEKMNDVSNWIPGYKIAEDDFRVSLVQAPTAFRTTTLHRRDDSSSTLAVYLPEYSYDTEKAFTRSQLRPIAAEPPGRGTKFWFCMAALMTSSFLIVLDLVGAVKFT